MMSLPDYTPQDIQVIETAIIEWLYNHPEKKAFQDFNERTGYVKYITMPDDTRIHSQNFQIAIWSLIAKGLVYFNNTWLPSNYWYLKLTDRGIITAQELEYSPYKTDAYIQNIKQRIPTISSTVQKYAYEALKSFQNECYLACAVMIGVASESAFFEMIDSFLNHWLQGSYKSEFERKLKSKRQYNDKFQLFRETIERNKNQIDKSLWENMEISFNSLLDIFRLYRNDAGHAIGKSINASDIDLIFHLFPKYIERLYDFKAFFDTNTQTI